MDEIVVLATKHCVTAEIEHPRTAGPGAKPKVRNWIRVVMVTGGVLLLTTRRTLNTVSRSSIVTSFADGSEGESFPGRSKSVDSDSANVLHMTPHFFPTS